MRPRIEIVRLTTFFAAVGILVGSGGDRASALPKYFQSIEPRQYATSVAGGVRTTSFSPPWNSTQALSIFVTSTLHDGNLGGLEGARTICQARANAVPALAGSTWYPLLSDSTWDARSLTGASASSSPVYNIDGTVIASTRAALWNSATTPLLSGVRYSETGDEVYDFAFTASTSRGYRSPDYCNNWTSTEGFALLGSTDEASDFWFSGTLSGCEFEVRLFCIGNFVPSVPTPTPTATITPTRTPTVAATATFTRTPTPTWTATPGGTVSPTSTPSGSETPTPLASPTPTLIPVDTATSTPSTNDVALLVTINSTPVPLAPLLIDSTPVSTDELGFLLTTVQSDQELIIETGLPAIVFTPVSGTGASLGEGLVLIEAQRLVHPGEAVCEVSLGDIPHLFFPYINSTANALTVPTTLVALNRFDSPSDQAVPAQLFAPGGGGTGFLVPQSYFSDSGSLSGTWHFLGTSVAVPSDPPVCVSEGNPASCTKVSLENLFSVTKQTIAFLTNQSLLAKRRGTWKPTGNFKGPFFTQGAVALRSMRALISKLGNATYECDVPPADEDCSLRTVSKSQARRIFQRIFPRSVPTGLRGVAALIPGQRRRFEAALRKIPDKVYVCPE